MDTIIKWFEHRMDNALWALSCDDEACFHYGEAKSFTFRIKLGILALFQNETESQVNLHDKAG